jgi:VWFA-related protein
MAVVLRPLVLALFAVGLLSAADGDVVFRSDVSLVRVDAHVLDRNNRVLTGLGPEDFILFDNGRRQQISNFAREEMPVDVVLLLDVSGSMRTHVERIASASRQALRVLGRDDRVAIMVFDRATRLRLPFRGSRDDVGREFERLLDQETFDGGTDITRGLLDAAAYIGREGRRDARRAIVILTDDQTERERDEERVSRALMKADAVLMALIAPDALRYRSRYPADTDPLGGIIFGRRGGSRRGPVMGSRTKSAGTAEIARESGGDSMPVDDAGALETTLSRIRERYALHFHLPEGVKPGEEQIIDVQLADAARARYPNAQVHFRRVYLAPGDPRADATVASAPSPDLRTTPADTGDSPRLRRRVAVNERDDAWGSGPIPPAPDGGWRRAPPAQTAPADAPVQAPESNSGRWRRVKPGEQP